MRKIFIVTFTLFAFTGYAQLKVGSNPKTIQTNTNFQVESSTGNQFIITKDTGKVGIGTLTPAASLDVIGKVKITDGTQGVGKVLVSDANGRASWQNASSIQASSTDSTTASNGLTLSGKEVQLGGTLTKATTITTSATNTIAFSGLQSGAASDSILVSNPSTGVVRRISPAILGSATEPWFNAATNAGATANTQNIYQMGRVGINVNNPTEQLEVNGNIFQRGYTFFRKATGNSSAFIWTNFNSGGDAINYSFNYHNADGTNTIPNTGYTTNSIVQQNGGIYFRTSDGKVNQAPTLNAMMVSPAGRVGINTVSPSTQLHIIDSTGNGPLRLDGLQSGATTDSILVAVPSTGVVKRIAPATLGAATEPWYNVATNKGATANTQDIYQLGRIGIGTKSPLYDLHVLDSTATNLGALNPIAAFVGLNSQNNAIQVGSALSGATIIGINGNTANGELLINSRYIASPANGSNIQLIDGAGTTPKAYLTATATGVGIGTTAPTNKLHVKDTINNNPLRLEGLVSGNISTDSVLVSSSNGVVKRVSLTNAVDNSVGAIAIFPYSAIPSGYLECNGQAVSRTTYAMLFSKIGTTYGAGNGSTTFNLPDLRGEFVRGWDNGRGVDAGRAIGSSQNGSINVVQNTVVPNSQFSLLGLGTTGTTSADLGYDVGVASSTSYPNARRTVLASPSGVSSHYVDNTFGVGSNQWGMSRPRNVAMVYAMKVLPSLNFSTGGGSSSATEPWYSTATNTGATSNSENIYQMAKVGIGTSNPVYNLDVQSNTNAVVQTAHFVNISTGTSAESHIGIGGGPGAWAKLVGYNGYFGIRNYTTGTENFTINNTNGYVGIGTTTPSANLNINSPNSNTLISLKFSMTGVDKGFDMGISGAAYQGLTPVGANDAWIRAGASTNPNTQNLFIGTGNAVSTATGRLGFVTNNNERMTVLSNGNVGIGTNIPICALHVEPTATASYNLPNRQFIYGPSFGGTVVQNAGGATQSLQIAAYFGNRIQVNGFIESQAGALTLSDARAKYIGALSNNEQDLNTLNRIQITNYRLKDIQLGTNEQKKVIAQQLDTVFPQAVITQSAPKLMPTIYDYPKEIVIESSSLKLEMSKLNYPIKQGETLSIRFKDKEFNCKIINVNNQKIEIEAGQELLKRKDVKELFVYGTFVNDAKSVDYDALSMLNISATQAISKKMNKLEQENTELKNTINILIKELQEIKSKLK